MITKDEEIGKLRTNLKLLNESIEEKDSEMIILKDELDLVKKQQITLEKSLESEKAVALQEISRGKAGALQALQIETEKRIDEINKNHEKDKEDLIGKFTVSQISKNEPVNDQKPAAYLPIVLNNNNR